VLNIPYTIAELNYQRALVDTSTKEGIYTAVLVRTGSVEAAEKAKLEAWTAEKLASLPKGSMQ
jgi:hypothetical protein